MHERLQQRIQSLKTEYEVGQKMLADLEAKQANLRDTLLRISGAIQILEETLAESEAPPDEESNTTDGIVTSEATPIEVG